MSIVEVINDFLIQNTWDLQVKLNNTIAHCNTEDNRIVCVHMCACLEKKCHNDVCLSSLVILSRKLRKYFFVDYKTKGSQSY